MQTNYSSETDSALSLEETVYKVAIIFLEVRTFFARACK